MKFAVIVFPGSNCDHDAHHVAESVLGHQAECIWHKDTDLKGADVVILPGGFAHGDYLRVEQTDTPFTCGATMGQVLRIPIGHGEGNYYAPPELLQTIEANRQVILRYADPRGRTGDESNPNGSANHIAAVCNEQRN